MTCAVLIPARDEAATVAEVVRVALKADLGPVLVVDDGSEDATAAIAKAAGATVLRLPCNLGKGGAVYAGARRLEQNVIVLLDADLVGLTTEHLGALARPVLTGEVAMTRGVFCAGRWATTTAHKLTPQLSGQRAILRDRLLAVQRLPSSRYGIEVAIGEAAKRGGWRTRDIPLAGVSQRMKEEKHGLFKGSGHRLRMYGDIFKTLLVNKASGGKRR
jgi:glycosyltransferase involved in cell wall biosynthesis